MSKTKDRQKILMDILNAEAVFSQEELIQKLAARGIPVTQSTLSRDLKALHVVKVPREGYRASEGARPAGGGIGIGIVSIEFNLPVAVIKSQVGFAPAIATYLDRHPLAPIMGTLAGDDTVILAIRKGYTASQTLDVLSRLFPDIRDRYIMIPES